MRTTVLLVNFGAPRTLNEVPLFMERLTGRKVPEAALEAVCSRYRAIGGGSPLASIAEEQARLLADGLDEGVEVRCAYRYSSPTLEEMLNACYRSAVERIVFFVMSPFYASSTVGGYARAVESYLSCLSALPYRPEVVFIHSWHREPAFVDAWVARIREQAPYRPGFYLFSAHSLPLSCKDEPYASQVEETVAAVVGRLEPAAHAIGWQSAPPRADEPWMGPSVEERIDEAAASGLPLVEIPIGFVSDHLETLYDMDIVHAAHAKARGLVFSRIASLNTFPPFIAALRAILEKSLKGGQ